MENQLLAGRYRTVRLLGEGAFGQVFEAVDVELDRTVALKLLKTAMADEAVRARFEREARVTAGLTHPHVVTVFGHGVTEAGQAFLAYEFLEGYDLEAVVQGRYLADERTVLGWALEVAGALQYAHELGVVHRDVKPANVFLKGGEVPVLVDFGIARVETGATALTSEGAILGSPAYMAPEIWTGESPGPAADQFAWAVSVFELLYGQLPFLGNSPIEVFDRLQSGAPAEIPSGYRGRMPEVEVSLLRALALDPAERYPTMGEFRGALEDGMRGSLERVRALSSSQVEGDRSVVAELQEVPTRAARQARIASLEDGSQRATIRQPHALPGIESQQQGAQEVASPDGKSLRLWTLFALLVLAGFVGPSLRTATVTAPLPSEPRAAPPPSQPALAPLRAVDSKHLMATIAAQQATLTRAGADLLRLLGEDPSVAPDDRTVRLTFQSTERMRGLEPMFFWVDRVLSENFQAAFDGYLEALNRWFQAVTTWSKTRPEALQVWRQPEVRGTLEAQAFGVLAWVLEVCRLMHTDATYMSQADPFLIPQASQQLAKLRSRFVRFVAELETLSGRPASPWFRRPLRSLGLMLLPGPGSEMTWDGGDQLEAIEAMVGRFEAAEPGFEAYTLARVSLYILTFSVLDGRLEWSARDEYVGRLGRRLLAQESPWLSAGPHAQRRQRLLVRVLAEEMRLRRVAEVDGVKPSPGPVRARRVYKQVYLGMKIDPRGTWEGAYLAEALADDAGLPGLYNRHRNPLVMPFRGDLRKLRDEAWALMDPATRGLFSRAGYPTKRRRFQLKQGKQLREGPGEFSRDAALNAPGASP